MLALSSTVRDEWKAQAEFEVYTLRFIFSRVVILIRMCNMQVEFRAVDPVLKRESDDECVAHFDNHQ